MSQLKAPKSDYVVELRQQLELLKGVMTQTFLVEMKGDLNAMRNDANLRIAMEDDRHREQKLKDDRELLSKISPPSNCLFSRDHMCLPGT